MTSGMAEPLFEARDLGKSFGGTRALDGVDLAVAPGEFHALLGENGAGKSTLIKLVTGVHAPDRGEMRWRGRAIRPASPLDAQRLGIAVVHQESGLVPRFTMAENLALGREPAGTGGWVRWDAVGREIAELSERFGLAIDPRARVQDQPPAVRKRLEIVKALAARPDLLILDEPTAAFSVDETERLMELLGGLKAQGVAILYVTHRLQEIQRLVDRVTVLKDGRRVGTVGAAEATPERIVSMMVGHGLGELFPPRRPEGDSPGEVVLETERLGREPAFRGVDLRVRAGEIVGLVGLQGHGHFDFARAIFGAPPAASGRMRLLGREARVASPLDAVRRGIGFVSDDRGGESMLSVLSVRENVGLAALRDWSPGGWVRPSRERSETDRLVALLSIRAASRETAVSALSGGNQQKVAVARWLAARVRLFVLLDPTAGVDVGSRREIYRILRNLADEGRAVLVATSDLGEALGLCDRVHVFYGGRVAAEFGAERGEEDVMAAMTGQREAVGQVG